MDRLSPYSANCRGLAASARCARFEKDDMNEKLLKAEMRGRCE